MPTGGVKPEEENLKKWFNAGVHCVGMGSQLISKEMIESGKFDEVSSKVKQTLEVIKSIRKYNAY